MEALALDTTAQAAARRIALPGRLTAEQVAEHNRFIDEMRNQPDNRQDWVSRPSRFVGIKSGLPHMTTA